MDKFVVKLKKNYKEKIVAFLIFVMGLTMSFMIPTWQTPDEYAHLNMIGNSIGVADFAENILDSSGIEKGRIEFNYDEKVDLTEQENALNKSVTYQKKDMLPQSISFGIIKHLPATLGILLGILLGVPSYWVLQLGEIFSLLFYVVICFVALIKLPIKKEVMAFIMLFPMALQQAGSISYDAVLIPLCFFFICYILYLKYEKEVVGFREICNVILLWIVITYIKVPYVFLIFLILIIPLEKIRVYIGKIKIDEDFIRKIRIPVIMIGAAGIIVALYMFRYNKWIQIIYGFVVEWRRGLYLFRATGKTWTKFLMTSTVCNLGWLDTPMIFWGVVLVNFLLFGFAFINSDVKYKGKMRKWDVLVVVGTVVFLCVFTTLAMVNHTITMTLFGSETTSETYSIRTALYQIPYIGGLQGRYYLPFLSLFCLPFSQKIQVNQKIAQVLFYFVELLLYLYVIGMVLQRYWMA